MDAILFTFTLHEEFGKDVLRKNDWTGSPELKALKGAFEACGAEPAPVCRRWVEGYSYGIPDATFGVFIGPGRSFESVSGLISELHANPAVARRTMNTRIGLQAC